MHTKTEKELRRARAHLLAHPVGSAAYHDAAWAEYILERIIARKINTNTNP